jgi:hypothetical protein
LHHFLPVFLRTGFLPPCRALRRFQRARARHLRQRISVQCRVLDSGG